MQDSACVEVMTTLHGNTSSFRRHAEGCVPQDGTIASARDLLKVHPYPFRATFTLQVEPQIIRLGLPPYTWVHLRAFRASMVIVRIRHSFFSLQLRVLRYRYEFEYRLDPLCHVALVCCFHSMSLACFVLRAFVFLPQLDTSFHFVVTYSML